MLKSLLTRTAAVALVAALAATATTLPAEARNRTGAYVAGAIIGTAAVLAAASAARASSHAYYYGPGYHPYAPGYYYGSTYYYEPVPVVRYRPAYVYEPTYYYSPAPVYVPSYTVRTHVHVPRSGNYYFEKWYYNR